MATEIKSPATQPIIPQETTATKTVESGSSSKSVKIVIAALVVIAAAFAAIQFTNSWGAITNFVVAYPIAVAAFALLLTLGIAAVMIRRNGATLENKQPAVGDKKVDEVKTEEKKEEVKIEKENDEVKTEEKKEEVKIEKENDEVKTEEKKEEVKIEKENDEVKTEEKKEEVKIEKENDEVKTEEKKEEVKIEKEKDEVKTEEKKEEVKIEKEKDEVKTEEKEEEVKIEKKKAEDRASNPVVDNSNIHSGGVIVRVEEESDGNKTPPPQTRPEFTLKTPDGQPTSFNANSSFDVQWPTPGQIATANNDSATAASATLQVPPPKPSKVVPTTSTTTTTTKVETPSGAVMRDPSFNPDISTDSVVNNQ